MRHGGQDSRGEEEGKASCSRLKETDTGIQGGNIISCDFINNAIINKDYLTLQGSFHSC